MDVELPRVKKYQYAPTSQSTAHHSTPATATLDIHVPYISCFIQHSSPAHDGAILRDRARKVAAGSDSDRARTSQGHGGEVITHVAGFIADVVRRTLSGKEAAANEGGGGGYRLSCEVVP